MRSFYRFPRGLIVGLVIALFAISVTSLAYALLSPPAQPNRQEAISGCISNYWRLAEARYFDADLLYKINGFCYNSQGSQLLIDEEVVRRDNFIFQRHENSILLFMVVTITLSGVLLAGLQLLASYKLALLGRGELATGTEIAYSRESVSFKSAVVGLAILAISFAFFMVFVIDVYTLKEERSPAAVNSTPGINAFQPSAPSTLLSAASPPAASQLRTPELVANRPASTGVVRGVD